MDTVEVAPVLSRDSRRLIRATALLLAGAAAHLWLFPTASSPRHPGLVERMSASARSMMAEQVAATKGDAMGTSPVASTLGRISPGAPTASGTGRAPRVRVVVEAVRPSMVPQVIEASPMRLQKALLVTPGPGLQLDSFAASDDVTSDSADRGNDVAAPTELPGRGEPEPAALEPLAPPAYVAPPRPEHRPAATLHQELRGSEGPSDERLVSRVLQQYRAAYESLDVSAAQTIWPTVDARALGAAFRQLAGQRVTFDACGVSVSGSGSQATARCRGQAEYVPKVGGRRAYVASGEWVFDLAKQDAAWRIINANATIK